MSQAPERLLRWVAPCLLASGAGSLMLEMAWSRMLKLVFGSTTLAISTILVAYMLGLALGGRWGGRWAGRLRNGIATYGWIEIGIGLYAMAVPFVLGAYPLLQRGLIGLPFWLAAAIRFVVVLAVLVLPTVLMGATLPVLVAALVRGSKGLASRVGLLYGMNTLGAVLGVLGATFVMFPAVGLRTTNWIAAGLDVLVGIVALTVLAPRLASSEAAAPAQAAVKPAPTHADALSGWRAQWALASYGTVGFTALMYEVAWTRTLTMTFGSSVYAFATILAAFLLGIALGSLIGRWFLDRMERPLLAYGCGLALLGLVSWAALRGVGALPEVLTGLLSSRGISGATLVLGGLQVSLIALLGPTLILGALFPLLTRALSESTGRHAVAVGDVYFVNSLGSAVGAFTAGFLLIPNFGLQTTFVVALVLNFLVAAAVLLALLPKATVLGRGLGVGALVCALLLLFAGPSWDRQALTEGVYYKPEIAIDFGIDFEPLAGQPDDKLLYYEDGISTTVSIHRSGNNVNLRLNGKTDASLLDRSTQVLSAHIPALFGSSPRSGLIIGYASGMTAGSLGLHGLQRIDVLEIEPAVVRASVYFDEVNHRPREQPAVRVIYEDGRTFLAATRERYDTIISEPSNPWISGAANLFTREYFELAADKLGDDGNLLQWIQLYGMDEAGLLSILSALTDCFPYVYGFLAYDDDSDLLLLARKAPLTLDRLPRWERLPAEVQDDLARIDIAGTADLWSLLRLDAEEIRQLARQATVTNTDDNMFVELRAPWHLYRPSESLRDIFEPYRRGVLGVDSEDMSAGEIADVALAHLWTRGDSQMAFAGLGAAQARGASASGLIVEAELRLQSEPNAPTLPMQRLDQAVTRFPDDAEARLARAALLRRQGLEAEALADVDAALSLAPSSFPARELRMRALFSLRRFAEARQEALWLLDSPRLESRRDVLALTALCAAAVGDGTAAAAEMQEYLAHFPQSPDEWRWLAATLRRLERGDEADDAEANAGRSERNWLLAAHRHALYAELRGDLDTARESWSFVLQQDAAFEPAREGLARLETTP